jgi:formate/nitrite transporter FocA (FNT family)
MWRLTWRRCFLSGPVAGSNPGLAAFLKGAVGLPAGLTLVIMTGAELFTGNVFVMLSGLMKGKVNAGALTRNWVGQGTCVSIQSTSL